MCDTITLETDDATVTCPSLVRSDGTPPTMVIPPSIGVVLVLVGLALFLIDLKVANHGLPTAGAILSLVAGGLALLGAGVPYSGVLRGVLAAGSMVHGGGALRIFG